MGIYVVIVWSLINFANTLQTSHLKFSTHTLLLLFQLTICWLSSKNLSAVGGIGSAVKHCLLSNWGYGQEVTGAECYIALVAFSQWFLGTPHFWLLVFLAVSNMFDPILLCIAVSRIICSCLLTILQMPQAGAVCSDSRLHAAAWQ